VKIFYKAGRQVGGTTRLVDLIQQYSNGYLVVHSRHEAQRIFRQHRGLRYPLTYEELLTKEKLRGFIQNPVVAIDNLEMLLRLIAYPTEVVGVTVMGQLEILGEGKEG